MAERFMALWPLNIISDFDIRYCSLCIACEAYYDDGFYSNLLNNEVGLSGCCQTRLQHPNGRCCICCILSPLWALAS